MKLKRISVLAIIAICLILLRNLYFTIFPYSTGNLALADLVLTLFSETIIITFFLSFIKHFVDIKDNQMMNASIGLITISTGVLVINFINRLGVYLDSYWHGDETFRYIYILVNWLRAIILAYFFFSFYITYSKNSAKLNRMALFGFASAAATLIMQSIKLLNYFYYIKLGFAFISKESIIHLPIGLLLILVSIFGWLYFLIGIQKEETFPKID